MAVHRNTDGTEVERPLRNELDGTCRLIEYMPLLYAIVQKECLMLACMKTISYICGIEKSI
jgi:hypothetical protein